MCMIINNINKINNFSKIVILLLDLLNFIVTRIQELSKEPEEWMGLRNHGMAKAQSVSIVDLKIRLGMARSNIQDRYCFKTGKHFRIEQI